MNVEETVKKAERILKEFYGLVRELNSQGYQVVTNPNETLYVFKSVTKVVEEYGPKPEPDLLKKLTSMAAEEAPAAATGEN